MSETTTKYISVLATSSIREAQCTKETDHTVWLLDGEDEPKKFKKYGDAISVHDTYAEAKKRLLTQWNKAIMQHKHSIMVSHQRIATCNDKIALIKLL